MSMSWEETAMDYRKVFDKLRSREGIIACGVIDERGDIIECMVPEGFPKDKLSKVYALEVGMLRNLEELFGAFNYRITSFSNSSQIIYKCYGLYLVASSKKDPKTLLKQVEEAVRTGSD